MEVEDGGSEAGIHTCDAHETGLQAARTSEPTFPPSHQSYPASRAVETFHLRRGISANKIDDTVQDEPNRTACDRKMLTGCVYRCCSRTNLPHDIQNES